MNSINGKQKKKDAAGNQHKIQPNGTEWNFEPVLSRQ